MNQPQQQSFGRRREAPPLPAATPATPEPVQSTQPNTNITELRTLCLAQMDPTVVAKLAVDELTQEVERTLAEIATQRRFQLNGREQRSLARELVNDMLGLGPLEPLLEDDTITDIMVNGPERVFVERRGKLNLSSVRFRDTAHVAHVCQRIASRVGRRIDESSPMVDARLKDGSRVNIVFPPLALDGPYISIRKFSRQALDFRRLVEFGSLSQPVARILELAARARLNIIISGGTGSGKTTLLNALSRLIDGGERIVTIEDAAELQLQQPHVVRLETRVASLEGRGEITQRDLMRNALRMRPDRIIVGEVRGAEAFDMLQAMNTGHDGSMSTIHANSARDALTRIENMVQMGNMGLPARSILIQIVGAVDLIVQIERQRDGTRRVVQVTDVCGLEGDVAILNDIFQFATWMGCVMARTAQTGAQAGDDANDKTPAQAAFAPYRYPSTYHTYSVTYGAGQKSTYYYPGDNDWTASPNNITEPTTGNGSVGPNLGCPALPILPETASKAAVMAVINKMVPVYRGGTFINLGLQAGWWTLSPNWKGLWGTPTLPLAYHTPYMKKVIVLMTDGNNEWYDWPDGVPGQTPPTAPPKGVPGWTNDGDADFTGYGRLKSNTLGLNASQSSITTTLNTWMSQMCTTIKQNGIVIYTIVFNQSSSSATQTLFRNCASSPGNYFLSPSGSDLQTAFTQIGQQLSSLRLAQ